MTSPGRPESVTLQETLTIFDELGRPGTPLTTPEISERLDCTRRTAFSKLQELVEKGKVNTKKVGARGRVWWRPLDVELTESSSNQSVGVVEHSHDSGLPSKVTEQLLKTAPIAFSVRDAEGEIVMANDRAQGLLGLSEQEILGRPKPIDEWQVFNTEGEQLTAEGTPSARALATGDTVHEEEVVVKKPDGERRWFSVSSAPILNDEGNVEFVVTAGEDITELKKREAQLERRKGELESELNEVLERVADAFYALDAEWRFTHINDKAEEIFPRSKHELLGERLWNAFPDLAEGVVGEAFREAMETQDSVTLEQYFESIDSWLEIHAYPSDTGLSVYFRDVTTRKHRERELKRLEAAIRNVNDGVYLTDADRRYTFVNEAYLELLEMDRDEVIGEHVSTIVGEEAAAASREHIDEMLEGERELGRAEGQHHGSSDRFVENSYSLLPLQDGEFAGTTGVVRDITERKQREWELERYKTMFETVDDGIFILGPEFHFEEVNDAYLDLTGYSEDELLGSHCSIVFAEADTGRVADLYAELAAGDRTRASLEADLISKSGDRSPAERKITAFRRDDGEFEDAVGIVRDLSDREAYERNLRRYEKLIEGATEVNSIVDESGTIEYVTPSAEYVLGYKPDKLEGTNVFDLIHPDDREHAGKALSQLEAQEGDRSSVEFRMKHRDGSWVWLNARGRNLTDDPMIDGLMVYTHDITERKEYERELQQYETLIEESTDVNTVLDSDGTFRYLTPSVEHVLGYGQDELVGENGFEYIHPEDREAAMEEFFRMVEEPDYRPSIEFRFQRADGSWVVMEARGRNLLDDSTIEGIVAYTRDVTERTQYEEWLSSLNELNELFQETVERLIDSASQEAVERAVCEQLVKSDLYDFAWIGRLDEGSEAISVRASAGTQTERGPDNLAELSGHIDSGPSVEAAKSGDPQFLQGLQSVAKETNWQTFADERGYESLIAIPITYRGTLYGVLTLYSSREEAFEDPERAIVSRFGRVIAHAISTIEREHALTTEEVVEIEFRLDGVMDTVSASTPSGGKIRLDQAVPVGEGGYVGYGEVTASAFESLRKLPETTPEIESVKIYDESADVSRFEATIGEESLISKVTAENAWLREATIADGTYTFVVQLPPTGDTRNLVESVQELYPDVEMVAQRRTKRETRSVGRSTSEFLDELTDRQRTVIEAAYNAGFFEWPRERNGKEIAETLDISSPTLHQHLRAAERKLLGSLIDDR